MNKKTSIRPLILVNSRYRGGTEINLLRLLSRIDRNRVEPVLLLPQDSTRLLEDFESLGVETWPRPMPAWRKGKHWPFLPYYFYDLVWEIYEKKIDLILGIEFFVAADTVVTGWLSGRPSVVWFQDPLISFQKCRSYLIHRADAVIVPSEYLLKKTENARLRGQSLVIPNGIDTGYFQPVADPHKIRAEYGIAPEDFALVSIGRITEEKGQKKILEALSVLKNHNKKLPLLLLAGDCKPDYLEPFQEEIKKRDLQEHVRLLGFQPEVQKVLAAADAFILLSADESFSLVTAEAMAMQLPCIYTPVGGIVELVGKEDVGWPVDRDAPENTAEAIHEAMTAPERCREKGRRARHRVQTCFSLERQARSFEDFLLNFPD